jgi:hypothetical protein
MLECIFTNASIIDRNIHNKSRLFITDVYGQIGVRPQNGDEFSTRGFIPL